MGSKIMYESGKLDPERFFKSKSILITGACGTIGKYLAKHLITYEPRRLRLLDFDDTRLTELKDELQDLDDGKKLTYLIGDVRDKSRLIRAFEGIDYVFHCAALKHVAIGEYNPGEVIQTNVLGTENVIEAALQNNVEKVIYTSSDKAVNPTSTMGASKLLGEKLMVAANYIKGSRKTVFSAVRFGNVMGSRGSVIPRFRKRVQKELSLIVTDPDMTRFMMPIQDAVRLTIEAMLLSYGGEIFVLKMPSVILKDLVDLFSEHAWMKYGIIPKIETIGHFPGEKNYEELMTEEELSRTLELPSMYIILPHIMELQREFHPKIQAQMGKVQTKAYSSQFTPTLSKKELESILRKFDVFTNT